MVKKTMNFLIEEDKRIEFKMEAVRNKQEMGTILNYAIDDYIKHKGSPIWLSTNKEDISTTQQQ